MRSVYLMKTSHNLYKVGIANDVSNRQKNLQTSNGSKILIVTHAKCGNAMELERKIHGMLVKYRQPGGREWFELTPEQAIKVCIYIHQSAEYFYSEDEIQSLLREYSASHEKLVDARKELEIVTDHIGGDIHKAIARLQRFRPAPVEVKKVVILPSKNTDNDLYDSALTLVKEKGRISTSAIQRHFRIGYGRASRIIDQLEESGIVSPADGAKARKILVL